MADGTLIFDTELNTDGLNEGLENLSKNSGDAAKKVSGSLLKNLSDSAKKTAESINSYTSEMMDSAISNQKAYESEVNRINENKKKALEEFLALELSNFEKSKALREEELSVIERAYELGVISADEYFESLSFFRDKYFSESSDGWISHITEVIKENKRLTDEQKKALTNTAKDMADNIQDMFESIAKEREKLEEKLESYGGIKGSHTFDFGDKKQTFTTLADTAAQNERLIRYYELMMEAQKRINDYWRTDTGDLLVDNKNLKLRQEYFSQMRDMSVDEATDFASLIAFADEKELFSHLAGFENRQYLAESISNLLFSDETKGTADSAGRNLGKEFSMSLLDEMESLDGEFFIKGQNAMKSFSDGFMANFDSLIGALSKKISESAVSVFGSETGAVSNNIENNTSYNIYPGSSPQDTIRLIREQEEIKKMLSS